MSGIVSLDSLAGGEGFRDSRDATLVRPYAATTSCGPTVRSPPRGRRKWPGGSEPSAETTGDATLSDGEEVTVRGTVDDVIADAAFTLTDVTVEEGTVDKEGEVTVIATEGDADVSKSEGVVVTGTLLSVDISEDLQRLRTSSARTSTTSSCLCWTIRRSSLPSRSARGPSLR